MEAHELQIATEEGFIQNLSEEEFAEYQAQLSAVIDGVADGSVSPLHIDSYKVLQEESDFDRQVTEEIGLIEGTYEVSDCYFRRHLGQAVLCLSAGTGLDRTLLTMTVGRERSPSLRKRRMTILMDPGDGDRNLPGPRASELEIYDIDVADEKAMQTALLRLQTADMDIAESLRDNGSI